MLRHFFRCMGPDVFNGAARAPRAEFWSFFGCVLLLHVLAAASVLGLVFMAGRGDIFSSLMPLLDGMDPAVAGTYAFKTLLAAEAALSVLGCWIGMACISVTVRRLHDIGLGGKTLLAWMSAATAMAFLFVCDAVDAIVANSTVLTTNAFDSFQGMSFAWLIAAAVFMLGFLVLMAAPTDAFADRD